MSMAYCHGCPGCAAKQAALGGAAWQSLATLRPVMVLELVGHVRKCGYLGNRKGADNLGERERPWPVALNVALTLGCKL